MTEPNGNIDELVDIAFRMVREKAQLQRLLIYYAVEHSDPIWDREVERNFPEAWRYIIAMRRAFKKTASSPEV